MAFDSKPRPDSVSAFASLKSETLLRRLEPRIMFDAAAVETAIDALHTDPAHEPIAIDAPDGAMDVPAAALHGSDLVGLADHLDGPVAVQTMPGAKTIVFIDANVPDLAVLEAAIADTSEIVVLDPAKDGLDQVAAYLADRHDLDAIHIISHGEPGKLHLGSSTYDAATLKAFDAELGQIGASLQQGGDILIYGCDVAKGASGDAFVHKFAQLTHHDVAASTDLTGSAAQGGNWTLETHTGAIEAATIAATGWHGELAALNISVSSQPVQTGGSNTGAVGLWTNAGTIGGVAIDIRATVISADPGATVTFASAIGFYDAAHTLKADDMWVQLTSGSATVKWEIFQSGTNQTLAAVGDPNFRISDIDGSGGAIPAAPTVEVEAVAPDLHGLTSYTLDSPTNLNATIINGDILVRGTQNQNAEPTSLVAFNWTKVTSWDVTYTAVAGWGGRNFFHDGNGDFKFVSPQTVNLLAIDADAKDSTAAGASYKATFVELAAPVPVVDSDVHIAQHSVIGANIDRAEVILTNAQTADELLVGGSSNSSGTIDGLSYTISSAGGQITVALSGNASPATYEAALHAITFNNTSHDPSSVDRNLTVSVTNDTYGTTSNLAASTILVSPVNDAPVEVVPGAQGAFTNVALAIPGLAVSDIDADGGLETVTLSVAHGTLTLPVKAGLTFTTGDGTADTTMVFKGTLANINAALATLSYTSAASYAGIDTLTFTTNDNGNTGSGGALSSGAQTVAITVVDPPHATDDAFYTTQDTPITVSVLANDTDLQSYPLTVTQVDGHAILAGDPAGVAVTGGIVTLDATGKLTYTPDAGYLGTPTFTYTVDDGHGLTDTATVNGSVTPLNHAPVNVLPGNQQAVGGTVVFSAANGNAIQVTDDASATQIIQTTVSVDKGTLTLHQLTGLTFLAGDGTADATITMQGTKAAINAALDGMTMTGPGGTPTPATLTIKTDDLGHPNGEDIPNGSFETTLLSVPAGGQLTMLESNVPGWKTTATDHMIEIWGSGFQGVPAYEGIHFAELNANQVAADYNTSTIPKGQPLTFSFAHRGRAGVDVMNVTVIDAGADGVFGTADDTTLMNQNYSDGTSAWGAYSKDLGAASGNPVRLIFNSVSSAGGATLGNFLDAVHLGTAHLTDTDTVMINFNRPPAANPDSYNSLEDHIVTGNVLSNDTDPDGNTLTVIDADGNAANGISPVTGPAHGTLLLNADGTFKYYPDNNYNGTDSFTYRVSDGNGGTAEATATITIAPVNDAPHVTVNTDTPTTLAYAAAWWHSSFNTAPNTMSPFTASAANELAGPGLSLVVSGTHADVSGVDATSYAGAIANGEYIQYSFTTTGTVDPNVFIAAAALNNPGATGTVAIQLATHADFSDARTMTDGVALNTSAYADFNDRTYLEPNTTYYVRAYLYNVPGTQRWDDFGVLLKKAVPDYVTTFTEGDAPVAATNTASADANDKGEADLTHLTITANGIVDGAAEHLTIGGKSFTLSSSSAQSVAFGTTTFQLTYNATTHIFDVQNAAGSTVPMLQADVDTLLRSLSYENTSQNPSTNDRTFAVQVTDSGGLTSNIATATIHVVPVNDPPEVVVSLGDKTGLDGSAVLIVTKGAFADPDGERSPSRRRVCRWVSALTPPPARSPARCTPMRRLARRCTMAITTWPLPRRIRAGPRS